MGAGARRAANSTLWKWMLRSFGPAACRGVGEVAGGRWHLVGLFGLWLNVPHFA
jgi:hypothetical protein